MDLRHILLAEDDPGDVALTLQALREHHLANRVVVARDGVETLEHVRAGVQGDIGLPAVLLLDVKMPRLSGLHGLACIRADADLESLPVVMLTSSREEADLQSAYDLGANAYVVKPVDFKEFVDAARQVGVFWALLNEPAPVGRRQ